MTAGKMQGASSKIAKLVFLPLRSLLQMTAQEEFAPALCVDFTNQDHVFLILEELGVAHMQNVWMASNDPEHADAAEVAAQAQEFSQDIVSLLAGEGEAGRFVDNGWVGERLAAHLRAGLKLGDAPTTREVMNAAVSAYLQDLEVLMAHEAHEKALGKRLAPKEYVDLMIAWSGLVCGKNETLDLPMSFAVFKAAQSASALKG